MSYRSFISILFYTAITLASLHSNASSSADHWDILVVAPHPDDETLGAAGVMMQALKWGKKVGVVVLTNGDGYPLAASTVTGKQIEDLKEKDYIALAYARQKYVEDSLALINFPKDNLHFLGYPDGGLSDIYHNKTNQPYLNTLNQKSSTYGPYQSDFHSRTFEKSAPYIKSSVESDLTQIIKDKQPKQIFVTSAVDGHSDHQAAFWFVRDAALVSGFKGQLHTYLIHSGTEHGDWPFPYTQDHTQPFQAHSRNGETIPDKLSWPPQYRVPLTPEQAHKKLDMINQFDAEIITAAEYMRAFIKSEEIFWPVDLK